ncbi:hypothetical protein ABLE94_00690 [Gordonia sp. VNK1]|uniref:hypothetical protein n=1 Tax=Gordonia oleivorans TaxID=3156618 RepID=UPI0032B4E009
MTRRWWVAVVALVGIAVAGCGSDNDAEQSSPATETTTTTTTASESATAPCPPRPAVLSGGVFPTQPSTYGTYAHVDAGDVSTNYQECGEGLAYAVVDGANGDRDSEAGTGASLFTALVIFVDGAVSAVRPYEFRGVSIDSASADTIIATVDTRERGIDPPAPVRVEFTLDGTAVTSSPDIGTVGGSRLSLDLTAPAAAASSTTPTSEGSTIAGPQGDSGTYRLVPASTYAVAGKPWQYSFALPSKQVACFVGSTSLLCETEFSVSVADGMGCGVYSEYETTNAHIFGWSNFQNPPCSSLVQGVYRDGGTTLDDGTAVSMQPATGLTITCYSRSAGLACENREGDGFTLTPGSFQRYRVGG